MYTDEQIKQFVQQQGIADNPYALYNFAKQYGVAPGSVDRALGMATGTSDNWIKQQGLHGLAGSAVGGVAPTQGTYTDDQVKQFIGQQGAANNPHQLYALAQQYGVDPTQVDRALGANAGASNAWIQQQGLGALSGSGATPAADASRPWGTAGSTEQTPAWATQMQQRGGGTGATGGAPASTAGSNPYLQPSTQQTGMPNQGTYQPNTTGNPYTPMAGGQGGQGGQQGGNPYMPGGGRQQGWAPPWDNANPNTQWMAGQISQGVTDHLQRNLLPGIRSQASMAGGLGGSRQGIAEGLAVGDAAKGLSSSLAGLYGGQYNQDRNYGLANDALDLNVYNSNQNWMQQGQQNQIGLIDKMLGWNQQGLQTAGQAQNTPLNYYNQFMNAGTQLGGMGSQQSTPYYGNPVMGAIGGAQLGTNIYNAWNKPAGS